MNVPSVWRIRDSASGLWSTGGIEPKFTKRGKAWGSRGAIMNHLLQLVDIPNRYSSRQEVGFDLLGETWEVIELAENGVKFTWPARDFITTSPKWREWEQRKIEATKPKPIKVLPKVSIDCSNCHGTGKITQ